MGVTLPERGASTRGERSTTPAEATAAAPAPLRLWPVLPRPAASQGGTGTGEERGAKWRETRGGDRGVGRRGRERGKKGTGEGGSKGRSDFGGICRTQGVVTLLSAFPDESQEKVPSRQAFGEGPEQLRTRRPREVAPR